MLLLDLRFDTSRSYDRYVMQSYHVQVSNTKIKQPWLLSMKLVKQLSAPSQALTSKFLFLC